MLEAIRDYYYATGKKIGMKPAGGIATAKLALQYLVVVRETLGQAWLNPDLFRFGASSLANDLLMQILKQKTGLYQSIDYFSKDWWWSVFITIQNENNEPPASINPAVFDSAAGKTISQPNYIIPGIAGYKKKPNPDSAIQNPILKFHHKQIYMRVHELIAQIN